MGNNNDRRTRNSVLNLTFGLGRQLLSTVFKFIRRTVFIHTLGTAYLGIGGLFSELLSMLSLTELGLGTAINFQLYKPIAENDGKRVRILLKFYKQAYRVIGFVILGFGVCLIPALRFLIKDYDTLKALNINAVLIFLLYLLQSVSSYWFFAYISTVMNANQKKYILDIVGIIVSIFTNLVQIIVLVFFRNFVVYTAIIIVFNIITNIVNALIARKFHPNYFIKEDEKLSKDEVVSLFKDCGALFIYKVNGVVLKATDNTVLSAFIGLAIVGLYSNYLVFYNTIKSILGKVYTAVKASMGNLFATSGIEKKYKFFEIMNYLTVILYGTAAVGVAVCADEVVTVWIGKDYVIKQPFALLVGIEILLYGLKINLGQIRNISGAFRQMWFRPVLGIIINLFVSITLVQIFGIYGVIIGTITADLSTYFLVDPSVIHKFSFEGFKPVSAYYIRNVRYFFILVAVGILDRFACGLVLPNKGWLSVITHIAIVSVTVPGAFILLFYKSHECQYLFGLAGKILATVKKRFQI